MSSAAIYFFFIHSMTNLIIGSAQLPTDATANRLSGTLSKPLTGFSLQALLIHLSAKSPTLCPAAIGML